MLTVNSQPSMQGARQVTVVPVASEQALRTRAWVEANRRLVDKLSNGQLAYVYVPNTGQGGYQSFNRYYFAQQDKQGAIIDERFNGGGSAADYIIDVLQRDFDGYFNNVAGDRRRSRAHRPASGAQGHDHQRDGGVGRGLDAVHVPPPQARTAGGQAHVGRPRAHGRYARIHRRRIDDRAARRLLHARREVGRRERRRRPRHRSRELPKDVIAGRDPQLERAVDEAMKLLKAKPVDRMTTEPRRQPGARGRADNLQPSAIGYRLSAIGGFGR